MLEISGKYNSAKIFTDVVDNESISQVMLLLNQEFVSGSKIRLMPDIHAGAGCTIGTTMTITDKIVPNLMGVDIGCGMLTVQVEEKEIDFENLDKCIRENIPSGFNIRSKVHQYSKYVEYEKLVCKDAIDWSRAEKSVGTLGGGNHFIEVDKDDDGNLYLVIHTGSRHFGLDIATHYQRLGYNTLNNASDEDIKALVDEMKAKGEHKKIEKAIKALRSTKRTNIPKDLCYVEGQNMKDYLNDVKIAQEYAIWNRKAIADTIICEMGLSVVDCFTTTHNYIDLDEMILRKGSVSAKRGEKLLIPINMRDGSLICIGKGNEDWNYSAPHGAGRLMSRGKARETLSMEQFEREMSGIFTTSVNRGTLDESPMAYKSMDDIVSNIEDTASIISVIKPVYNFKAGE